MIQVKFKNFEKSEMTKEVVENRLENLLIKFPDLHKSKLNILLEMENSPTKAGLDSFKVKIYIKGGRYHGISLEKSNQNIYVALADVYEHMLEALNRFGDKLRVRNRKTKKRHFDYEEAA
jgi:ribosome-associated translation inhibitor RaiA